MGKSIFDFADEDIKKIDEIKIEEMKEEMGEEKYSDMKSKINEYKNLSQSELMQKLLEESEKSKKNGTFDIENIKKMAENFSPYLNQNQKETLDALIEKMK